MAGTAAGESDPTISSRRGMDGCQPHILEGGPVRSEPQISGSGALVHADSTGGARGSADPLLRSAGDAEGIAMKGSRKARAEPREPGAAAGKAAIAPAIAVNQR